MGLRYDDDYKALAEYAKLEIERDELKARVAELEGALRDIGPYHSNEWSDYVCNFCGLMDGEHESDCKFDVFNRTHPPA